MQFNNRLYVRNFKPSIDDEELRKLFSPYGKIKQINIIKGRNFGFIQMSNPVEAKRAKKVLDNSYFEGRILKVDEAWPLRDIRRIESKAN